jgi:hypothetical protein
MTEYSNPLKQIIKHIVGLKVFGKKTKLALKEVH